LQLFVSACGRFEGMPDGCYTYYSAKLKMASSNDCELKASTSSR
jgi:hypothetical protein